MEQLPEPIVATTAGRVRGTREHGLTAWRGIPYAAPPVGELRFRAPVPPEPWTGIRDAAVRGPVPPQRRTTAAAGAGRRTPMSEDCLTLSVLRRTRSAAPRPVMVYLHGGAFAIGSGDAPVYDGSTFVAHGDVVYVTVNYRLGALGWMDFSRYSTPERPFDSNPGLRDQIAALTWVRDNIAAFGGDPDEVTVFGESAGGTAIAALLCTPAARGLFARAIIESGVIGAIYGPERPAAWAAEFVELLGATDQTAVAALTTATADALVDATSRLDDDAFAAQPGTRLLAPVVDGELLPKHPLDAFRDGESNPVPLIIGTNADEGTLFQLVVRNLAATPPRIDRLFELTAPEAKEAVLAGYPAFPRRRSIAEMVTDFMFWNPAVTAASGHARVAPTWLYRFDFATRLLRLTGLGATHTAELDFVFGRPDSLLQGVFGMLGGRRAARAVTARMHRRWLRFASTGTVGDDWPRYDAERRLTLLIDEQDRVEPDPRSAMRRAWESWRPYR
ncbi:MAG TPA: carboxylesterase/lipase family protein [Amnibacterium sp.]